MNTSKIAQGIGINDAEYQVCKNLKIDGKIKRVWVCPIYAAWKGMLERCYSRKVHERKPTYQGCSVSVEWHRFSDFSRWMLSQDWEGNCLDKDILVAGNKIYSPEACVLISKELNNFLTDRTSLRGDFPIGVSWHSTANKFVATCSNPFSGANEHLGLFLCPDEAHKAWKKRKHQIACIYADMQKDSRAALALRARFA